MDCYFRPTEDELTRLFNVARVNLLDSDSKRIEAERHTQGWVKAAQHASLEVRVRSSSRTKCPRCRTFRKEKAEDRLCNRCEDVVGSLAKL